MAAAYGPVSVPHMGPNELVYLLTNWSLWSIHHPSVTAWFHAELLRGNHSPYIILTNPTTGVKTGWTLPWHGLWIDDRMVSP